ncbi:hypothetical protein HID58_094164 [Brassica napus]|uniref:Uncharacterized protein n=1 Tax=Brassica napus TaxID=3708 RepID=A0ABQ7X8C1_BRANA|nr:hypothetical protein HID58_094164 [Brassica napus]
MALWYLILLNLKDYYYDPALYDYNRVFPPCDVNYVNNLHLQEALASSLVTLMKEEINHHPQPQRHVTLRIKQEEEPTSISFRKKRFGKVATAPVVDS